jgi:hypothetical protein
VLAIPACNSCLQLLLDELITVVSTLAGGVGGTNSQWLDATGTSAGFNAPNGVAADSSGNVYVADYNNYRIRKVTPLGGTQFFHYIWCLLAVRLSNFATAQGPMHCAFVFFLSVGADGSLWGEGRLMRRWVGCRRLRVAEDWRSG